MEEKKWPSSELQYRVAVAVESSKSLETAKDYFWVEEEVSLYKYVGDLSGCAKRRILPVVVDPSGLRSLLVWLGILQSYHLKDFDLDGIEVLYNIY